MGGVDKVIFNTKDLVSEDNAENELTGVSVMADLWSPSPCRGGTITLD